MIVRKLAGYGTALIALYIAVAHGSDTGNVISAGASGLSKLTGTLQGRNV